MYCNIYAYMLYPQWTDLSGINLMSNNIDDNKRLMGSIELQRKVHGQGSNHRLNLNPKNNWEIGK